MSSHILYFGNLTCTVSFVPNCPIWCCVDYLPSSMDLVNINATSVFNSDTRNASTLYWVHFWGSSSVVRLISTVFFFKNWRSEKSMKFKCRFLNNVLELSIFKQRFGNVNFFVDATIFSTARKCLKKKFGPTRSISSKNCRNRSYPRDVWAVWSLKKSHATFWRIWPIVPGFISKPFTNRTFPGTFV